FCSLGLSIPIACVPGSRLARKNRTSASKPRVRRGSIRSRRNALARRTNSVLPVRSSARRKPAILSGRICCSTGERYRRRSEFEAKSFCRANVLVPALAFQRRVIVRLFHSRPVKGGAERRGLPVPYGLVSKGKGTRFQSPRGAGRSGVPRAVFLGLLRTNPGGVTQILSSRILCYPPLVGPHAGMPCSKHGPSRTRRP